MKADRKLVLALVVTVGLGLAYWLLSGQPAPAPAPAPAAAAPAKAGAARRAAGGGELPDIGLARVLEPGPPALAGKRDIFAFGPPPTQAPPPPTAPAPTAVAVATPPPVPIQTGPPPPPPLNVKFIGSVEDKRRGFRWAVLLTDRQEILTGKPGEVVANRLKIVSIGLESVDVQDVGASGVRRIPLKGN